MARIYSSRLLLDPSVLQMANAAMQNRIANETALRKWVGQSVGSGLQSALQNIGGAIDSGYQSYKDQKDQSYRRDQINNFMSAEQLSDPFMRATAEEYIRTGDAGKMTQYMLGKEAAEARREAAAQSAQERADTKNLHDAVRLENARQTYIKNLDAYNKAETETEKEYYLQANTALEKEFGSAPFGQTMESYKKAYAKDKQKANDSFDYKMQFLSTMPAGSFRNENDRRVALETIKNARDNGYLTDTDYKDLVKTVNSTESLEKTRATGTESVVENKRKEGIAEKIDEVKAKKALAKKANAKKAKGLRLFKDEQEALDEYGDQI